MEKQRKILMGLLGTIGSGKTTVSNYLVKKGFARVIMGDLVREEAKEERVELTRENLQVIQEKYCTKYGEDFFINKTIKKLKKSGRKKLLIDGIRTPIEAEIAKKNRAILVMIDAPPKIRFVRLKERKRENDPQIMQEFLKQEKAEWKAFNFKKTLAYVDYKIDNSGTPKQTYKKIDALLEKISKN